MISGASIPKQESFQISYPLLDLFTNQRKYGLTPWLNKWLCPRSSPATSVINSILLYSVSRLLIRPCCGAQLWCLRQCEPSFCPGHCILCNIFNCSHWPFWFYDSAPRGKHVQGSLFSPTTCHLLICAIPTLILKLPFLPTEQVIHLSLPVISRHLRVDAHPNSHLKSIACLLSGFALCLQRPLNGHFCRAGIFHAIIHYDHCN